MVTEPAELSGIEPSTSRADDVVLSVESLAKSYTSRKGATKEAIRDISFQIHRGEFVCVVGPSGAGKTTLLRCLGGLLAPSQGQVKFEGKAFTKTPEEVAIVFQDYSRSLFPWLTVASNIALPLKRKGGSRPERDKLVKDSLAAVGLDDAVGKQHPWQLSGGMQQRVAIARALAYQPKLLLMDEPFASVDAQTRFGLEDLILKVREEFGMTIVFVTHDIDESVYVGDRVIALSPSPCTVQRDLQVPLGSSRDQVTTRSEPIFAELRGELLQLIMGDSSKLAQP
jgi:NitT/TauT family transport system ATP-binding protein